MNFSIRRRWCCKIKLQRLIQDRDPPFNMLNLIIKFMILLYMGKSIQMIKLPLKSLIIFIHFMKKNHIYRKNKHFTYLIAKMKCLGDIRVPKEDALLTPCTKFVSLFLRN